MNSKTHALRHYTDALVIDRLTTERDALAEALRQIADDDHSPHEVLRAIARAALAQVTKEDYDNG